MGQIHMELVSAESNFDYLHGPTSDKSHSMSLSIHVSINVYSGCNEVASFSYSAVSLCAIYYV